MKNNFASIGYNSYVVDRIAKLLLIQSEEVGAQVSDFTLRTVLKDATDPSELIPHLYLNRDTEQLKPGGIGACNKIVIILNNELQDRFDLTQDQIDKMLDDYEKEKYR